MSQQSVIAELQRLGMSGYEAKAYVALVAAGSPLNGYEVAKRSGGPRSTVYETLAKLVGRGAAYEVRAGEASVGYISLPPASLLDRLRREFDQSMDTLRAELPQVASPPQVRLIHNLADRASLLARAEGVEVSVVVFGDDPEPVGQVTRHRFSEPEVVLENLGCRLLVVSADREQAVIGGLVNGEAWGGYTHYPAVVLVGVEYVRHDIAMHLIAKKLAPADFESFWATEPALLRLRADHGAPAALLRRESKASPSPRRNPSGAEPSPAVARPRRW